MERIIDGSSEGKQILKKKEIRFDSIVNALNKSNCHFHKIYAHKLLSYHLVYTYHGIYIRW